MEQITVRTERLTIFPQSAEEMSGLCRRETDPEMKRAYAEMLETMRRSPGREEWGTAWKICLKDGAVVGSCCFKGVPDPEGVVEIGYGIDEPHRCNGYATEAVAGLVKWALARDGVRCVAAQTELGNRISRKVLLKVGFVRDGYGDEGPLYKLFR